MKNDYPDDPHRLSHSTENVLNQCERLFQLDRLLIGNSRWSEGAATTRGKAFGAGVQYYMATGDWDRAILECWLVYNEDYQLPPDISVWRTLNNMYCAKPQLDKILSEWEIAVFRGRPATELAFKLRFDEKWYYGGSIDLVLRNKTTGRYAIFEVKTTMYWLVDLQPSYKNSGQALGYSIVLDTVAGAEQTDYNVVYLVCRDHKKDFTPDIYVWPFEKTLLDRLNWFIRQGLIYEHVKRMDDIGIWPMSGNCVTYNKPCVHFGTCHMTASDEEKIVDKDETHYDFEYNLQDVIDSHLKRISV